MLPVRPLFQEPSGSALNGDGIKVYMSMFPVTGPNPNITKEIAGFQAIGNIPEEGIYGYPADGINQ